MERFLLKNNPIEKSGGSIKSSGVCAILVYQQIKANKKGKANVQMGKMKHLQS